MLMKSRTNTENDLHKQNLTQLMFEEEVPVEVSHIMNGRAILRLEADKKCLNLEKQVHSFSPSQCLQGSVPAFPAGAILCRRLCVCTHVVPVVPGAPRGRLPWSPGPPAAGCVGAVAPPLSRLITVQGTKGKNVPNRGLSYTIMLSLSLGRRVQWPSY